MSERSERIDGSVGNLPGSLDRLVGRDAELAALARLRARLVTLHGPGGAGKTRLATEFATRAGERFPGGAWLVELAAVTDPALVAQSVAAVLRVSEQRGQPLPDTVADALFGQKTLLVLDNCEHLVDACARLVVSLLDRCPELTVLATSREVLDVPGETVVPVGALAPSDAAELFAERAGTARRGFQLTGADRVAVAGICERLDGNALAIELAARRVRMLPVTDILHRLDDRFRLLTAGPRTVADRHRDLRAAVEWSYDLLDDAERAAFRRLSVLAGGFGLAAAATVCDVPETAIVDLVDSLAAKSLLAVTADPGRFRQLESIRLYAHERLTAAGELAPTRQRLVDWLVAIATPLAERLIPTVDVLGPLDAERDTIAAALEWSGRDLLLSAALARCWRERGYFERGRALLREALAAGSDSPYRSTALAQAVLLATDAGDFAEAEALAEEAIRLDTAAGRRLSLARAVSVLAGARLAQGDTAGALSQARRAQELARPEAQPLEYAVCVHNVAFTALHAGQLDEAAALLAECLPIARTRGEPWLRVGVLHTAGLLALEQHDLDAAEAYFQEAVQVATAHLSRKVNVIEGLTIVAARRGRPERALRLAAATVALRSASGIKPKGPWSALLDDAVTRARAALGPAAAQRAVAVGEGFTAEQTIAYALSANDDVEAGVGPLTRREAEVAELVAAGLSNRQLAGRLGIAERTVEAHLDNVRAKLDLRSRTQVAAWWVERSRPGASP
jgi:predicted ATPase/DNA-binding CsgD family transcriptional regulator